MRRRLATADEAFSYACNGCGRCCHDKRIAVSPYEIARLAETRGTSTGTILANHTAESGTVLRFTETGCTFLVGGQCTVHAGRPLVCRLYPLGRYVDPDGRATFVEVEPHPESEGIYGADGTVADWLAAQGALPYIEAAKRTFERFEKLLALVDRDAIAAALGTAEPVASDWLDVDAVVARASAAAGVPVPSDVEARYAMYLDALDRWIDACSA